MPVSSGTTPDVSYDFTSGNILLSDLRQASQKLQELITLRSKLAGANLTYQNVNGQQQGWVGTAYSEWASQFDRSQNDLNGYLDQLNWHIVNMNNFLYDTELRVYKSTQRTRLPAPAPPPSPARAPVNNFKLTGNPEGATPVCLYGYSDQTTSSNDQIRPFFKVTLPGAAGAYPNDPQYRASAYTGALIPVSGLAYDIADFLRQAVLVLDARVRIVGQAFENADRYGITAPGSPDSAHRFDMLPSPDVVNGLARQIANGAPQSAQDGANAARQLNAIPAASGLAAYSQLLKEIADHQDDPAWTSAFFNNANGARITMLLDMLAAAPPDVSNSAVASLAQAYATALGAGNMSDRANSNLIDMVTVLENPAFNAALFTDLKTDPGAASNFVNMLSASQQIQILNGPTSAQFIDLYTAILSSEPDLASVNNFYNTVTPIIFKSQPATAAASFEAAQRFLATYISLTLPALPANIDDGTMQDWINNDIGPWISELEWGTDGNGGWHQWVKGFESANLGDTAADQQGLGLALGAASTVIMIALTEAFPPLAPVTAQVIMGTIFSVGSNWITGQVDDSGGGDPTTDPETMDDYARFTSSFLVTAELLASGKIIKDGQVVQPSADPQVIQSILEDTEQNNPQAPQYYVAGTDLTLRTVTGDVRGQVQQPNQHMQYGGKNPP